LGRKNRAKCGIISPRRIDGVPEEDSGVSAESEAESEVETAELLGILAGELPAGMHHDWRRLRDGEPLTKARRKAVVDAIVAILDAHDLGEFASRGVLDW
jgi:hypothetical protein